MSDLAKRLRGGTIEIDDAEAALARTRDDWQLRHNAMLAAGGLQKALGVGIRNREKVYTTALDLWGEDAQVGMMIEEAAELIQALMHRSRGRIGTAAVITEIADVQIMCEQLAMIYGVDAVAAEVDRKIDRLRVLIEETQQ